ncbi:MAG: hypothetical protein GX549_03480 [Clostridiales bacterium]|nr:hypothetical protein [Clostridiales bacterium]
MKSYHPFFVFCRFCVRMAQRRPRRPLLRGAEKVTAPAVLVARHQNLYGPISIMAWYPVPLRLWVIDKLAVPEACREHYRTFVGPVRLRLGPIMSRVFAALYMPLVVRLVRSGNSIIVYRGQREIMKTLDESVQALCEGEILCLSPDIDYTSTESGAVNMYTGFVHLAKKYFKRTGKSLPFYPVYTSRRVDSIEIGDPVYLDPDKPFFEEKERVVDEIRRGFEQMAQRCGDTK